MVGAQSIRGVAVRLAWLVAAAACAVVLMLAVASRAGATVPGAFTTLATSPEPLTALTTDPTTGLIYAQGFGDSNFYIYNPATNTWGSRASAPIAADNDGGAAYLNGKIYVAYPEDGTDLGVYDIATNKWSTVPTPLGSGTGNITAVGSLLYLVGGNTFVSFDPATNTTKPLANVPDFMGTSSCDNEGFDSWGALAGFKGKIYGTQGNGCNGFAVYDIATDTWTQGPNVPDGAVLGGTIDPTTGTFYAYGDYEGSPDGSDHFYAYDIASNKWSTPPNVFPFSAIDDGGLTYVSTPSFQGVYAIFGEEGVGFVSFSDTEDAAVGASTPAGATAGVPALISNTVTDNGTAGTAITFTDHVAAGLTINSAFTEQGPCSASGQVVTCTITGLLPTKSVPVYLIVTPSAPGSYTNSASVTVSGVVDPNTANNSASATLQVASATVSAPPAKCVVPKLKGTPAGVAKHVLTLLDCTVGKVKKAHSKTVHKGNVIKTSPKAGSYAAKRAIGLQVSSGPKHHKKKGHHHK